MAKIDGQMAQKLIQKWSKLLVKRFKNEIVYYKWLIKYCELVLFNIALTKQRPLIENGHRRRRLHCFCLVGYFILRNETVQWRPIQVNPIRIKRSDHSQADRNQIIIFFSVRRSPVLLQIGRLPNKWNLKVKLAVSWRRCDVIQSWRIANWPFAFVWSWGQYQSLKPIIFIPI